MHAIVKALFSRLTLLDPPAEEEKLRLIERAEEQSSSFVDSSSTEHDRSVNGGVEGSDEQLTEQQAVDSMHDTTVPSRAAALDVSAPYNSKSIPWPPIEGEICCSGFHR